MPRTIILYGHGSYRSDALFHKTTVPPGVAVYFFVEHNGAISEYRMQEVADAVLHAARDAADWENDATVREHLITPPARAGESIVNYRLTPPDNLVRPNLGREVILPDYPLVYGTDPQGKSLADYFANPNIGMPGNKILWIACRSFTSGKETPAVSANHKEKHEEYRSPLIDLYLDGKQYNSNYHRQ